MLLVPSQSRIEENPRGFLGKVTYRVHEYTEQHYALSQCTTQYTVKRMLCSSAKYTTPSRRGERVLLNLAHSSQVLRVI